MGWQTERRMTGAKIYIAAAVLLCIGVLWYIFGRQMTIADVIRLSQKGEALRAEDFTAYNGERYDGSDLSTAWYDVWGDYELRVDFENGENIPFAVRLYYEPIENCCIDIRCSDVSEFVGASDKSKYILDSRDMTIEDVKRLSQLGEGLRQEHLMHYSGSAAYWDTVPAPDGINFVNTYWLGNGYKLEIGDDDLSVEMAYARLMHIESGEYIDIRTGDAEGFLSSMTPRGMTMEDVRALAQKGESLSKEDLKPFIGAEESDSYVFDIDDDFLLYAVDSMYHDGLGQVRLELKENWRYHMDIRYGDIDAFIAQADAYKGEQKMLNAEDVIRISQKGTELKPIDFAAYYMSEPPYLAAYEVEGGYLLRILEMEGLYGDDLSFMLWWEGGEEKNCAIDLRIHDAQAFIDAEDKSQYALNSRPMTMEDVKQLSELGEDLWVEHFIHYAGDPDINYYLKIDELRETGKVELTAAYEVDEEYRLELWDDDGGQREPIHARLMHIESGEYIDIRTGSVNAFLEKRTK